MDRTSQGSRTATATMKRRHNTERGTRYVRVTVRTLFACILVLITINAAVALSITNIQAPSTITEGSHLQLSFTTDTPATYRIFQDGIEVSASNTYSEQLDFDSAGLRVYTFEAKNANTTINEMRTIEILDASLSITVNEPVDSDYATTAIPVQLETNIAADVCYTVTEAGTHTLVRESPTSYTGSLSLIDGLHTIKLKCNRNGEIVETERTIKVDTTPPSMSLGPSGTIDDKVTLTATTNEVSMCKYGTNNQQYSDLPNAFPETTSLMHQQELEPGEGTHTYYVACRDVYGNAAASQSTTFTLREKPSARLSIEGVNPHMAGSYDFTLEVSEQLREPPKLTIVYQGGSSQALVLTEVDETTYQGVIIVADNAGEQVASFSFAGTDLSGLEGTRIEQSELFLVDTIKPGKVETFRAVNGSNGINLSWYFVGDDVRFNIYRTTGLGVDYNDFYTTTMGNAYLDTDTTAAVKYYYRIAAVDEAGNVGPLSHEEWASRVMGMYAEQSGDAFLDPVLQVGLDERLQKVELYLLDAEASLQRLRLEQDETYSWLINTLNLVDEAQQATSSLKQAKSQLEQLRSLSLTKTEFEERVTNIQKNIDDALASLPLDAQTENQATYEELPDESAIEAAANHVLRGIVIAEGGREAYLADARQIQDGITVTVTATHARVRYANEQEQAMTIIEKQILAPTPVNEALVIETIPKTVAKSADEIDFRGENPLVLEKDPVVQYTYNRLTDETITYVVNGVIPFPSVKDSRIVILSSPGDASTATSNNLVTGESMSFLTNISGSQNLVVIFGIIIVIGLAAYYLSIKDDSEEPFTARPRLTPQPSIVQTGGPTTMSFASTPLTQTVLIHRKHEPLVGLLLHGHELVDETRYLDALHFYKQALARFDEERFSSNRLKESVRQELVLLHAKLSLLETINKAHDACYVGDTKLLTQLMQVMRANAVIVGDESSVLVEKAKTQYSYFYNRLNSLCMEAERALSEEQPL